MQGRDTFVICIGLALPCAMPAAGQEALVVRVQPVRTAHVLVVADDVWKELARLSTGAKRETVRCLIGFLQGDTAYIEIAWQPRIHRSSPSNVRYGGCPQATLAKWHNHLARFAPTPMEACYLSDTDVADALVQRAPPLQVVQVNERVMCWWTQRQVRAVPPGAILGPIPRQLTGTPVTMPAGDGPLARSP